MKLPAFVLALGLQVHLLADVHSVLAVQVAGSRHILTPPIVLLAIAIRFAVISSTIANAACLMAGAYLVFRKSIIRALKRTLAPKHARVYRVNPFAQEPQVGQSI